MPSLQPRSQLASLVIRRPKARPPEPAGSGGTLEKDVRCAERTRGEQAERIRWTAAPAGRYRIGVDFPEGCEEKAPHEVTYRLLIEADGRREEVRGRARLNERDARAFEFTLPLPKEGPR